VEDEREGEVRVEGGEDEGNGGGGDETVETDDERDGAMDCLGSSHADAADDA